MKLVFKAQIQIRLYFFRFIHYAMPKKSNIILESTCSLEFDDATDSDQDEDLSDEDMINKRKEARKDDLPSLAQILIVVHLLGDRHYVLSQYGTKKFLNKVREMQELSQVERSNDVNYGSRMGKSTEILCKISALAQVLETALSILQ